MYCTTSPLALQGQDPITTYGQRIQLQLPANTVGPGGFLRGSFAANLSVSGLHSPSQSARAVTVNPLVSRHRLRIFPRHCGYYERHQFAVVVRGERAGVQNLAESAAPHNLGPVATSTQLVEDRPYGDKLFASLLVIRKAAATFPTSPSPVFEMLTHTNDESPLGTGPYCISGKELLGRKFTHMWLVAFGRIALSKRIPAYDDATGILKADVFGWYSELCGEPVRYRLNVVDASDLESGALRHLGTIPHDLLSWSMSGKSFGVTHMPGKFISRISQALTFYHRCLPFVHYYLLYSDIRVVTLERERRIRRMASPSIGSGERYYFGHNREAPSWRLATSRRLISSAPNPAHWQRRLRGGWQHTLESACWLQGIDLLLPPRESRHRAVRQDVKPSEQIVIHAYTEVTLRIETGGYTTVRKCFLISRYWNTRCVGSMDTAYIHIRKTCAVGPTRTALSRTGCMARLAGPSQHRTKSRRRAGKVEDVGHICSADDDPLLVSVVGPAFLSSIPVAQSRNSDVVRVANANKETGRTECPMPPIIHDIAHDEPTSACYLSRHSGTGAPAPGLQSPYVLALCRLKHQVKGVLADLDSGMFLIYENPHSEVHNAEDAPYAKVSMSANSATPGTGSERKRNNVGSVELMIIVDPGHALEFRAGLGIQMREDMG
ncbi:hypothetical protein OE88DRAFT_1644128 [Heliocybe sulcata]|uniref:Uncharacterized protein n=1 Tax=Heliocybe sulcata TaxID=5364 RepID=A0A5C3N488_9AGAM|nr:hypothetical protein OE88DRAFT_1644128 [Heliocybe sulcata]